MKRFGLMLAGLVVAATVAQSVNAAWTFMSPADYTIYGTTSNISFAGYGGTYGTAFSVECVKDGVWEEMYEGTCGMMGYWGGTMTPPVPYGWTPDSGTPAHFLYVWVNGARQYSARQIQIAS